MGGRRPFDDYSFHVIPIGVMVNVEKNAGGRSNPSSAVPPPIATKTQMAISVQISMLKMGYCLLGMYTAVE